MPPGYFQSNLKKPRADSINKSSVKPAAGFSRPPVLSWLRDLGSRRREAKKKRRSKPPPCRPQRKEAMPEKTQGRRTEL